MTLYGFFKLIHVAAAVLGVGAMTAFAVTARGNAAAPLPTLRTLARIAGLGLGLDFLTGVAIDWSVRGVLHAEWWFRLAAISLLATGAVFGYARRSVGRALDGEIDENDAGRARAVRHSWRARSSAGSCI